MKPIEIFYDKAKLAKPLFVGIVMSGVIGLSLTSDNITTGAYYAGLVILVPCLIITASLLMSFIKSAPPLTISDDGIIDLRVSDEVIEWDSIQDIRQSISLKNPAIVLSVPDRIEAKRKFSLGKLFHNFEAKLSTIKKFIPINTFGLSISGQELFYLIQRYRKYHT